MNERIYIFGRTVDFMDGFIMDVFDVEPHLEAYKVNDLIASRIETNRRYYQNVLIGTPEVVRQAPDARILLVHTEDGILLDYGIGIIYTSHAPLVSHETAMTFSDLHDAFQFIQHSHRYRVKGELRKFRFIPVTCSQQHRATIADCKSAGCQPWYPTKHQTAIATINNQNDNLRSRYA